MLCAETHEDVPAEMIRKVKSEIDSLIKNSYGNSD